MFGLFDGFVGYFDVMYCFGEGVVMNEVCCYSFVFFVDDDGIDFVMKVWCCFLGCFEFMFECCDGMIIICGILGKL